MSPFDVYIAVPSRGQVLNAVVGSLGNLCHTYGLRPPDYQTGLLTATDARNRIRKNFLASDCKVLLMVDYDVEPVHNILEMAQRGLDICGAPVMLMAPQANIPFFNVYNEDTEGQGWWPVPNIFGHKQLLKCDAVGFGAIAIHRRVIETLPPFWLEVDEWGLATRSEDLVYCQLAKRKGFEIYADFEARADHITSVNLRDLQERNAAAFGKYLNQG